MPPRAKEPAGFKDSTLHPLVTWPFRDVVLSLDVAPDLVRQAVQDATANDDGRLSHTHANALLSAGVELTGRPDLALLAVARVEPGHFDLIELASRSQSTVGEGLATLAALVPILHDGLRLAVQASGDSLQVVFTLRDGLALHPAGYDFIAAMLITAGMRYTGHERLDLRAIEFPYPRPADPGYLERFFACPLRFDAPALALHFPSAALALPLLRGDASVGKLLRAAAAELLPGESGATSDLVKRVRAAVREGLGTGEAALPLVARKLHASTRTLRRRLSEEGVVFRTLVDEERRERALERIDDERLSTEALAAELGFTTAQAFHRAFRRWTGTTVQAYRAR